MKNYFDGKGNYINCENLTLKEIFERGFDEGFKKGYIDGALHPANERPQGEWMAREDMNYLDENKVVHNHFQCNKCGLIHDFIDGHTSQYNFCPNCGADMRGAENETN